MRLAFMGTPDFAVPTLTELVGQGHDIATVYSQPPRPRGRGLETEPSPVAKAAANFGIPVRTPLTLKNADAQAEFAALDLDAAIVVAYGLLLPKPILDAPRLGCFNLHGSLLPRWRGAAPIQRAIMAGDADTGVMVMRMEEGLDTGPVLMAERTPIGRKTYRDLHDELARLGADLMARAMSAVSLGQASETPQPKEGVTYAKKILKEEARIDWTKSARELDCLVRGLSPFPGAWCEIKGERVKILFADPVDGKGMPGEALDDALTIACGEGALRVRSLQRPGKAAMAAEDMLRGYAVPKGTMLS
ncbi:MAG TPA: methionyl-tRNA formyltransferase [Rhizomicrobium sp.]